MTNADFYIFMERLHRVLYNVAISDDPDEAETINNLVNAYIELLAGQDEEIIYTLRYFFIENRHDHGLSREQTDMLLDYIRNGNYRYLQ